LPDVPQKTQSEEKTFVCTVGTLAETAKKNQITKTALMIIGNAVSQGNYRRSDLYNPAYFSSAYPSQLCFFSAAQSF